MSSALYLFLAAWLIKLAHDCTLILISCGGVMLRSVKRQRPQLGEISRRPKL